MKVKTDLESILGRKTRQEIVTTDVSDTLSDDNTTSQTFTNSIGMEFVLISKGSFMMGSPDSSKQATDHEKPRHRVKISQPFYLGKYPVTQSQWQMVMGDNPSCFGGVPDHPVEQVSWNDVQEFMRKLNEKEGVTSYHLPTEAQWEYAARAGTEAPRYPGGIEAIAWYAENSNGQTQPVGQKWPNAWELYDMLGNVWEWVQDRYNGAYYQSSPTTDPESSDEGDYRVNRGGSWSNGEEYARSARRNAYHPDRGGSNIGFRCACTATCK